MIRNYLNYVGSKDRLVSVIDTQLDKTKDYFIDLFCGSGVVTANVANNYKYNYMNDGCWQLMRLHDYIHKTPLESILIDIDREIAKYGLSKTDKDAYLTARNFYNTYANTSETFYAPLFYALITHSFNYMIHINAKGQFNTPAGTNRSYFSNNLRNKLIEYKKNLADNINNSSGEFQSFIRSLNKMTSGDLSKFMIYVDPPYFCSDSSYSRIHGLKWTDKQEKLLYNTLDSINDKGGSFLLSNVTENNGQENIMLKDWVKNRGYTLVDIPIEYTNCNYQRKNKGRTTEVLVKNY